MKNVTIVSHLKPSEWKLSWEDKVVEDTRENMKEYQQSDCFWGHFTDPTHFIICHHKAGEIKGMSLGLYFTGSIEKDEKGSRITGSFGRKRSANLFLGMGAILCILALVGSVARSDTEVMIVAAVLLVILFIIYFTKPQSGQQVIMKHLEKISFDADFHNRKRKKKRSILSEDLSAIPTDGIIK